MSAGLPSDYWRQVDEHERPLVQEKKRDRQSESERPSLTAEDVKCLAPRGDGFGL